VLDRREERRRIVERDASRHASTGETDTVADEQQPVAAGDVVEVRHDALEARQLREWA
jgi:hypothetical protein